MTLQLITPPTLELVTLAEMKGHLKIEPDDTSEDTLIAAYTRAAISHLDGYKGVLGWCLGAQTWLLAYDRFPDGPIRLPIGPLIEVVGIEYADAGGAYVTLPDTAYTVDSVADPGWIVPVGTWPSVDGTNAVRITFRVGHESAADRRLDGVKAIVMLMVGHWHKNREAVGEAMSVVPMSAADLIAAHRRHSV